MTEPTAQQLLDAIEALHRGTPLPADVATFLHRQPAAWMKQEPPVRARLIEQPGDDEYDRYIDQVTVAVFGDENDWMDAGDLVEWLRCRMPADRVKAVTYDWVHDRVQSAIQGMYPDFEMP